MKKMSDFCDECGLFHDEPENSEMSIRIGEDE